MYNIEYSFVLLNVLLGRQSHAPRCTQHWLAVVRVALVSASALILARTSASALIIIIYKCCEKFCFGHSVLDTLYWTTCIGHSHDCIKTKEFVMNGIKTFDCKRYPNLHLESYFHDDMNASNLWRKKIMWQLFRNSINWHRRRSSSNDNSLWMNHSGSSSSNILVWMNRPSHRGTVSKWESRFHTNGITRRRFLCFPRKELFIFGVLTLISLYYKCINTRLNKSLGNSDTFVLIIFGFTNLYCKSSFLIGTGLSKSLRSKLLESSETVDPIFLK